MREETRKEQSSQNDEDAPEGRSTTLVGVGEGRKVGNVVGGSHSQFGSNLPTDL